MTSTTPAPSVDWVQIATDLAAPFPADVVSWRPQGKADAGKRVQVLPYIDARDVQDRLDQAVGIASWSFQLEPVVVNAGELQVARGRLTIHGISKDDVGTASNFEASKGCASDALKRAAVQWGVGRYLYAIPAVWVTLDAGGKLSKEVQADLTSRLKAWMAKHAAPAKTRAAA